MRRKSNIIDKVVLCIIIFNSAICPRWKKTIPPLSLTPLLLRQSNYLTRLVLCPPLSLSTPLRPNFMVPMSIASYPRALLALKENSTGLSMTPVRAPAHVTRKTVQELRVVRRHPKRQLCDNLLKKQLTRAAKIGFQFFNPDMRGNGYYSYLAEVQTSLHGPFNEGVPFALMGGLSSVK